VGVTNQRDSDANGCAGILLILAVETVCYILNNSTQLLRINYDAKILKLIFLYI